MLISGPTSKDEALEAVQIGDPVTYADDVEYLNEDIISARALDNRIGGFAIAQAMKKISANKKNLAVNVVALNSVQEEVGGFGARMMSYRHMPDAAIVTDVTHATDSPGIDQKEHGQVKLGSGGQQYNTGEQTIQNLLNLSNELLKIVKLIFSMKQPV